MAGFAEGIVVKIKKMVSGKAKSKDAIIDDQNRKTQEVLAQVIKKYKEKAKEVNNHGK